MYKFPFDLGMHLVLGSVTIEIEAEMNKKEMLDTISKHDIVTVTCTVVTLLTYECMNDARCMLLSIFAHCNSTSILWPTPFGAYYLPWNEIDWMTLEIHMWALCIVHELMSVEIANEFNIYGGMSSHSIHSFQIFRQQYDQISCTLFECARGKMSRLTDCTIEQL